VNRRGYWQGMWTIARFNWPFYLMAAVVFLVSTAGVFLMPAITAKVICGIAWFGSFYFLFGSLAVSHWIYDRSDLYRWQWLERAMKGLSPGCVIFCHSGFDETSAILREKYSQSEWLVLDHFNERQMTESSIRRARTLFPPTTGTLSAAPEQWPAKSDSVDVVFGLLAIHELRSETERSAWFAEAARCLNTGGRILLVEHVRDLANFIAFGPGFMHFHSPISWRRCWESAGLNKADEFHITPFVRVFVIAAK